MFIYFVMLFQTLIASGTHIVAKIIVRDIDPITLTLHRSVMAAIGLLFLWKIKGAKFQFAREDRKLIALLSFLAIPVNQFLFLLAIKYTTPSNAALLYGTTPAVVLLISSKMGKENISILKVFGVVVAFLGILIVVFEHGLHFRSEYTFGNLLLVFAVIAWAFYTVLGRTLILKYGAFTTSATTMILGTLMFFPIGMIGVLNFNFSELTLNHWGGLLYLSIGTSIFAYLLWYYALSRITPTKVAIFANLQPVLTTILSALLLGQTISSIFLFGGSIALIGVIVTEMG